MGDKRKAEELFREVSRNITNPWTFMVSRSPRTVSRNWNVDLNFKWKAMRKTKRRARASNP